MKLLETSYLVDHEEGRATARSHYRAHTHEALAASTVSMFERAFGVVSESDRDLGRVFPRRPATLQQD